MPGTASGWYRPLKTATRLLALELDPKGVGCLVQRLP